MRDDAGTALVGVSVTLTDAQQQRRVVTTDATGAYMFSNLAPGQYQLTAQLDGFSPLNRKVKVGPAGSSVVNLRMRMAFDQRVEVVGSLAEFRRATGLGAVGLTLGPEQLAVLPNDPDMMLQVLRELSATTGRADQVQVQVDGQPVASRLPPKSAIQSIRISTNAFAAEFAEPSTGLVEIITKPANAKFRGEWQGTLNDTGLNAKNYFEDERRSAADAGVYRLLRWAPRAGPLELSGLRRPLEARRPARRERDRPCFAVRRTRPIRRKRRDAGPNRCHEPADRFHHDTEPAVLTRVRAHERIASQPRSRERPRPAGTCRQPRRQRRVRAPRGDILIRR